MNNLLTYTLISVKFLKGYTELMKNIDDSLLLSKIQKTQNVDLKNIIGKTLYNVIVVQYNAWIEAGNPVNKIDYIEQRILDLREELKPFLLFRTLYNSRNSLYSKITNKGWMRQYSDEKSENVDYSTVKEMSADWKNESEDYMQYVIEFLIENKSTYPEYFSDCDIPTSAYTKPIELI